jgi:apolipoprotein N-acyltransferase
MIFLLISFGIVAFGQPAWIPGLSPLAACIGYAIFWKKVTTFSSRKLQFWSGVTWFFCVQLIQLSWMTAIEYQGFYILVVYAALCFGLGLQFGLLTLFVNRLPHVAVAALWVCFEWARLYVFCGFSWNPMGLSLAAWPISMQLASVVGVLGLSFWVALTNLAWLRPRKTVWIAFALFPYLFGAVHLLYHAPKMEVAPRLAVGLVQTALFPSQKIPLKGREHEFIAPDKQWARILNLFPPQQKFDLIVFPEHVVPFPADLAVYPANKIGSLFGETQLAESKEKISNIFCLQALARRFSADVVAGLDASEKKDHFSAAYHVAANGHSISRYEKQILLPLAEYLPFSFLKRWTKSYGITEFFTPGKESKVFYGKIPFSVSICYEETFSELVRQGRKKGAELLVNLTNDGWYPASLLPKQHFDHGRIRAVENGAPLVRACNTGITAAIDSLGRVLGQIEQERQATVLVASVPTYHFSTLFTFWGNWVLVAFCIGILGYNFKNILPCLK